MGLAGGRHTLEGGDFVAEGEAGAAEAGCCSGGGGGGGGEEQEEEGEIRCVMSFYILGAPGCLSWAWW